jgi:hypothetical protein
MKSFTVKTASIVALLVLFTAAISFAQGKTRRIGNKPRMGSSNSSFTVTKGHQIGIKMNAGRKPVQLMTLNFGVDNRNTDSLQFKVNVYEFKGEQPGENLADKAIIAAMPPGKNRLDVDLSKFNIMAKGEILVAIEFLTSQSGSSPSFSIGLFNGGTYRYEGTEWKKMPVAGVDFNVVTLAHKKS